MIGLVRRAEAALIEGGFSLTRLCFRFGARQILLNGSMSNCVKQRPRRSLSESKASNRWTIKFWYSG